MKKLELRKIALGTARSLLREKGLDPLICSAFVAESFLDDFCRNNPDNLASVYWKDFDGLKEWRGFKRDWRKWQKENRRYSNPID